MDLKKVFLNVARLAKNEFMLNLKSDCQIIMLTQNESRLKNNNNLRAYCETIGFEYIQERYWLRPASDPI